ncbi:LPXTG cell wall anchor domain-containing protein, partial [Actinotignum urinale]
NNGGSEVVNAKVTVTKAASPKWDDAEGTPGAEVVVPNTGGKVPEGTTTDVTGPGKAKIDDKGNIVVDIDKDAKPGDKIVVTVKDKDGNVIDTATVTVTKGQSGSTGKKTSGKLVVTGVNVSGAITVGGILLLVGVAIVIARRKKNK